MARYIKNKGAYQTVTRFWDDGRVDMTVTKIFAGECSEGWRSEVKKGFEEYTDLFARERNYREYRHQCALDFKEKFSCVENF